MDTDRLIVAAVVGVIVVTSLLSGPVVGVLDVDPADRQSDFAPGEGTATVGNVSVPDHATLAPGEFGAGSYYLEVPAASATVEAVRGRPILSYSIEIDALGYKLGSNHYLSAENQGRIHLTISPASFDPDRFSRERYDGRIAVTLRTTEGSTTLEASNVTVEVVE